MCYLRVGNLKALYGDHKAAHLIHPNRPLQKKPWGQKEFAVAELEGTLLTFGETAGPDDSEERVKGQAQWSTGERCTSRPSGSGKSQAPQTYRAAAFRQ